MPKASNELLNRIIVGIIYSSIFLLVVHNSKNIYFAFWLLLLLILSVIEFIKITKNSKNFLFKLVITLAFILFPFFCIFLIKLNLNDGEQVLTFLLLLIWCSDVSSYLIGKYFGKIKLSKISPNKTLEGYIGSHISCLIMGPILISLLKLNLNKIQLKGPDLESKIPILCEFLLSQPNSILNPSTTRIIDLDQNEDDIKNAFLSAKNEARAAFGNDDVYIEKYLSNPRHIEVQIIGDSFGNVFHLGERECSIQRNHQKLIEEAPSPALTNDEREYICNLSSKAAKVMGYESLGTIEYLYEDGKFYFIEMNTRLQVEHPITEAITGIDIVKEQIKIASNYELKWKQKDIKFTGHSIECRINAENPKTFMPSPGKIEQFHSPGGLGIRIDSGIYSGYNIPPYYDSLIAKLIAHGKNRKECILKLKQAIKEMVIEPIPSTLELHQNLLENPDIINGDFDIKWLEQIYLNGK